MTSLYYLLLTLFLILSLFLVLLVLVQKGRGGGLSSAFGGVGGNTAFGAKTGDVLTWATSIVFGVFLLLAIGLNLLANHIHNGRLQTLTTPTTAPAAGTASMPTPSPASSVPMPEPLPMPMNNTAAATPSTVNAPAAKVPAPTTQR